MFQLVPTIVYLSECEAYLQGCSVRTLEVEGVQKRLWYETLFFVNVFKF